MKKIRERSLRRRRAYSCHDGVLDLWVQLRPPLAGPADVLQQPLLLTALHHIVHRAGAHGAGDHVVGLMGGEEQDFDLRVPQP